MLFLDDESILEKSINSGINMKFTDFIKFNKIDIDEMYVDKLFHNLQNKLPIYMNDKMIDYLGYAGDLKKQKEKLNNILSSKNFSKYNGQLYFKYEAKEYIAFRSEKSESMKPPAGDFTNDELYPLDDGKNASKTIHLLIMPRLFKEILMLCNTDKGKQVRSFYLNMVDVFELYTKYQNKLIVTSLEQKLDKMSLTLVESNQKADDERKRSEERFNKLMNKTELIQDRLEETREDLFETKEYLLEANEEILEKVDELTEAKQDIVNVVEDRVSTIHIKRNTRTRIVIFKNPDCDKKTDLYEYRIFRGQAKSVSTELTKLIETKPNMMIIYNEPNPNSIVSWNSIYNNNTNVINKSPKRNWFTITISEAAFIQIIVNMENNERKNHKCLNLN